MGSAIALLTIEGRGCSTTIQGSDWRGAVCSGQRQMTPSSPTQSYRVWMTNNERREDEIGNDKTDGSGMKKGKNSK
ncbi:unnamed protein product [Linum trigynum]|uniref:Secreted protein n=1 Tax=Linum trigynum TaxID=586398 RepID=A0AAV2DAW5_9ROSI